MVVLYARTDAAGVILPLPLLLEPRCVPLGLYLEIDAAGSGIEGRFDHARCGVEHLPASSG
jgi:hypothetical protein